MHRYCYPHPQKRPSEASSQGGGVLTYKGHTGMSHSNWSFFHKKSLDIGLIFIGKPLDMGPFFQNVQSFGCFGVFTIQNFYKMWKLAYIWEKILRNGYLFRQKWPLEMGRGFEARVAHPHSNQIQGLVAKCCQDIYFKLFSCTPCTMWWMNYHCLSSKFIKM